MTSPKPPSKRAAPHTTLYISPEKKKQLRKRCLDLDTNMTAVLGELIDDWLATTPDVKTDKSVSIHHPSSDTLSPEALSWARLAEAARYNREEYDSLWQQLRMCAIESLRKQGFYDAAEKLPEAPGGAQTPRRTGGA